MKLNFNMLICLWLILAGTGCVLTHEVNQTYLDPAKSAYWNGSVQNFNATDVLTYFQQLRTLSEEDLRAEEKRAGTAFNDLHRPVDIIQYFLVLALSETPASKQNSLSSIFSSLTENSAFLRTDVQELLFLLETVVSSELASQLHSSLSDETSIQNNTEAALLEKKLKTCDEQSKVLAGQIQKLKDIERILSDR